MTTIPKFSPRTKLIVALDRYDTLRDDIGELMVKALPIGTGVEYTHGVYNLSATVVGHSKFAHSVKVRGVTGKEYWIDLRRLIP